MVTSKLDPKKLVISLFLPFLAGAMGSYFTTPSIPTWYASLNKPPFNPPNWLFGPVWTLLFLLIGISFYLVFIKKTKKNKSPAYYYYFTQLIFNSLWSIVFFGMKEVGFALIIIAILWLLIFKTIVLFKKIDKKAANLLIPYILWVSFASILNFSIFILN